MKNNENKIEAMFAEESIIKVSVITVAKKRLTKGILNQIIEFYPSRFLYAFPENLKFFGFVNDKIKWVICTFENGLYKFKYQDIYNFSKLNLHEASLVEFRFFFNYEQLHKFEEKDIYVQEEDQGAIFSFKNEIQEALFKNQNDLIEIIELINERQIFI
jgi:hypothetical protein